MRFPWAKPSEPSSLAGHPYRADYEDPLSYDPDLYLALKAWRDEYAATWGLAPEDVLLESHLKHAALEDPSDSEELSEIGLDEVRIEVLGGEITALVADFHSPWQGDRHIEPAAPPHDEGGEAYEIFDSADHGGKLDLDPLASDLPRE